MVEMGLNHSLFLKNFYLFIYLFIFWPCHAACGILVPRPGIKPMLPAVEARSPKPLDRQGRPEPQPRGSEPSAFCSPTLRDPWERLKRILQALRVAGSQDTWVLHPSLPPDPHVTLLELPPSLCLCYKVVGRVWTAWDHGLFPQLRVPLPQVPPLCPLPPLLAWFVRGPHSRQLLLGRRSGIGNPAWKSPPRPAPDPGPQGGFPPARAGAVGRASAPERLSQHSGPPCPPLPPCVSCVGSRYI